MNLLDHLTTHFPAPWRQGTSLDRAWFNVGAFKVEVSRVPLPTPYWIKIKTSRGLAVGSKTRVVLKGLADALPTMTAEAVLRALAESPLTPADVPAWARPVVLTALRRPCSEPRAAEWQHRIDTLAAALETP